VRLWLALFVAVQLARAEDFTDRLIDFHRHYDRFMRDYFGCPAEAVTPAECRPQLGSLNRREYGAARAAAARLFDMSISSQFPALNGPNALPALTAASQKGGSSKPPKHPLGARPKHPLGPCKK
jgi:hypothetical protein